MTTHDAHYNASRDGVSEEAGYWWVVLNEPACSQSEREAFAKWVGRSPDRVEAFLRVSMMSAALKSSDIHWLDTPAEQLIAEARQYSAQVTSLPQRTMSMESAVESFSLGGGWRLAGLTLAAVLVVLLAIWIVPHSARYSTAVGEQRSVVLEDGSIVTINTSSEIEVEFSRSRRLINLVQGEALFEVSHDVRRPFDVVVDEVIVRAVGTKFNIDRRDQRTTVSVVEGSVKVMKEALRPGTNSRGIDAPYTMLTASQRVVLTDEEVGMPEKVPDLAPLTAWTQRQLIFESQRLAEVVAEFNRYNRRQILVRSPGLNEREITGVFQANDSYPLLVFIEQIPGVQVEHTASGDYVVTLQEDGSNGEGPEVFR